MKSKSDAETEIQIKIQKTLFSISDITLKINKELEMIEELVKKGGDLHMAVKRTNIILEEKAKQLGMDLREILPPNENNDNLELNPLNSVTSAIITEKLLNFIDN